MTYRYGQNEMINAEDLLTRLDKGNITIRDSSIYPYIYTHADNGLIANRERYTKFTSHQQETQREILKLIVVKSCIKNAKFYIAI